MPSSGTLPLDVDCVSFERPVFADGTEVAHHRGVIKIRSSGLICFVGNLGDWAKVENDVPKLDFSKQFEYFITSGKKPVGVNQTAFDQGSGRVCVLNCFENDIEILYFA